MSVEEAKKLLNDPTLSDEEVAKALSGMTQLVELIFDHWQEKRKKKV